MQQLGLLENEIRGVLGTTEAFSYAKNWPRWEHKHQVPIIKRFQLLFIVLLALFPNLVLAWQGHLWYVAAFTPAFLFVMLTFRNAFEILRKATPPPLSPDNR